MPVRNSIKIYAENHFYHVYNRGVNKGNIFTDESDYTFFLALLKRYLSAEAVRDSIGRLVPNYASEVELVAYCLMPNHYHMLIYLNEKPGLEHLMRSVMTAYSRYYNRRHGRVGALFQGNYLASMISSDSYLWQVSRYIHLNPLDIRKKPLDYPYSSIGYYTGARSAAWVHVEHLVDGASDCQNYTEFVNEDVDSHIENISLKHELASLD